MRLDAPSCELRTTSTLSATCSSLSRCTPSSICNVPNAPLSYAYVLQHYVSSRLHRSGLDVGSCLQSQSQR